MFILKLLPWLMIVTDVIFGIIAYTQVWFYTGDPQLAITTLFWLLIVTCGLFVLKLIPVIGRFI